MKLLLPQLLLVLPVIATAQHPGLELVRNGDFELVNGSVTTYDQLVAASGWTNATLGLAEVFDPAAPSKTVGIPSNDYGFMKPFDGERYSGFFGWKDDVRRNWSAVDAQDRFVPGWNSYSEYLQGELVHPLKKGQTYELVFRVALAGNSDRAIMGLGAIFPKTRLNHQHRKFIDEIPEVFSEELITEKGVWKEVRGTFVAEGGERFIVLGIYPYVGLESQLVIEGPDNKYAYFYMDGVSLKEYVEPVEEVAAPEAAPEGE